MNDYKLRVGNDKLLRLTNSSKNKLIELFSTSQINAFLRIKITGGGCNGLSYKMNFEQNSKSNDILIILKANKILIDPKTALFIKGTTLDYSHELIGGGFKFDNPNAKSSCSCGESFNL